MYSQRIISERGSALLIVMLMIVPLCAVVGLAADIGWFYFTREAAEAAAEAASLAAVRAAMDGVAGGGTYTCGSTGLACQAETVCPSSIRLPVSSTAQNACLYASANGFANGGNGSSQTVAITANVTSPAPYAPGVQVRYWVSTRITQRNPLTFLGVLGGDSLTVAVRSTAGVVATTTQTCLTVLDPSGSGALSVSNNVPVRLNGCNAQINSSSATAVQVTTHGSLTARNIFIAGGYTVSNNGTISQPTTGVPPISDPLASLPPPSFAPGVCDFVNVTVKRSDSGNLTPGNYCGGITIRSAARVTFSSGTYVLLGGGLNISAASRVSGTGVTFYNTCTSGACNGGNTGFQPFSIADGSTVDLSAPSSGSLSGILFFEDRTVSSAADGISSGSDANLDGTLYLPRSTVSYSSGSSSNLGSTVLVAKDVSFSSGSSFLQSTPPLGSPVPSVPTAALLQ